MLWNAHPPDQRGCSLAVSSRENAACWRVCPYCTRFPGSRKTNCVLCAIVLAPSCREFAKSNPSAASFSVCVNHLNRCKTSNFPVFKGRGCRGHQFSKAGGAGGTDETGTNKDAHQMPVISMGTLIDVPAFSALGLQFLVNGNRLSLEPACRSFPF